MPPTSIESIRHHWQRRRPLPELARDRESDRTDLVPQDPPEKDSGDRCVKPHRPPIWWMGRRGGPISTFSSEGDSLGGRPLTEGSRCSTTAKDGSREERSDKRQRWPRIRWTRRGSAWLAGPPWSGLARRSRSRPEGSVAPRLSSDGRTGGGAPAVPERPGR